MEAPTWHGILMMTGFPESTESSLDDLGDLPDGPLNATYRLRGRRGRPVALRSGTSRPLPTLAASSAGIDRTTHRVVLSAAEDRQALRERPDPQGDRSTSPSAKTVTLR